VKPDLLLLVVTVLVALTFDFLNGFHDAANSIATVVSTRVLSPKLAVLWAAFFNFVAAFVLGTAVAKTIGSGMIHIGEVTQYVVITGLLGAIVWDLLTWWWGLPTSSSHALIGGFAGAAVMRSGWHVIIAEGWYKTLIFIVVAPIMGLILGFSFMVAIFWLLRNKPPQRIDVWFRKLQLISAAAYSLGHGGNDAQKTMGIVASALYGAHFLTPAELAGARNLFRWLEDRAHDGFTHYQAEAGGRILRGGRGSDHAVFHRSGWNTGEYYAHHHGRDCGRGSHT
jgi:inorganic phosphate transporter, PiT family